MIELDGATLSGGGQIIRTALALSAHTNKPFRITNIRAKRPKPGLMAQHLEAVKTLQQLCNADVKGAHRGSTELTFIPKGFTPKPLDIHIGTAGAITLLIQALALPAMHHKTTKYTIHGGTDVRWSPPIDYVRYVLAPLLSRFGTFKVEVERRGYYPAGGGHVVFTFGQKQEPKPLTLIERGRLEEVAILCNASQKLLDNRVCEDIERTIRVYLDDLNVSLVVQNTYVNTIDPGYGVLVYGQYTLTEPRPLIGADVLGDEVGSSQEAATKVAEEFKTLVKQDGCVDEHIADHLIPFIALHGGEFTTTRVSNHVLANIHVTEQFLPVKFSIAGNHVRVTRSL